MRLCVVLLFVSLLTSCETQGTFGTPVFVLKGRDLLLKVHDDPPKGVSFVEWKFNEAVPLVRFDLSGKANVTGSLELGGKKFSLILKNLQEADSGVYSAVAITDTGDKPVAEFKVTVQGPAPPVELNMYRVDSRSSESCDIHVTCRTHNSHISSTFKCPKGVCSQEGGERSEVTTSGTSLNVYLLNSIIICNHSNQVHWTQDWITAEHLCSSKPDPPLHPGWVIVICILILALIMTVVLIIWLYNRQRRIIRSRQKRVYSEEAALVEMSPLNKKAASAPPQDGLEKRPKKAVPEGDYEGDYDSNVCEKVTSAPLLNKKAGTSPPQDGSRRRDEANLEKDPLEGDYEGDYDSNVCEAKLNPAEQLDRLEKLQREQLDRLEKLDRREQLDRLEKLQLEQQKQLDRLEQLQLIEQRNRLDQLQPMEQRATLQRQQLDRLEELLLQKQ